MATKEKKISKVAANALVHKVQERLQEVRNETQSRYYSECLKSEDYKEIVKVSQQSKALLKKIRVLCEGLKKKYPSLDINSWGDGHFKVDKNCYLGKVDDKRISASILTANHIDGIAIDNLVNHVVKIELARKEPKCE